MKSQPLRISLDPSSISDNVSLRSMLAEEKIKLAWDGPSDLLQRSRGELETLSASCSNWEVVLHGAKDLDEVAGGLDSLRQYIRRAAAWTDKAKADLDARVAELRSQEKAGELGPR
jgi:hypothetical protein